MQFSEDVTRCPHYLDRYFQALQGKEIILCLEANATSELWHGRSLSKSRPIDHRGEDLEDFILQYKLVVINKPDKSPAFDNMHGNSNIDVTLATNAIAKKVTNSHDTNSDRNLITFEITNTIPPAERTIDLTQKGQTGTPIRRT
ncbi:hypothetical protein QLX08_010198 [Tetragonisca angustula]|uniref:Endonuclease/exonuclease/phosphatase domain-containing protein n=1 Tax=Tetragonisca angustula TaxID=166442 RepID=A0AAW0ZEC9_9HYME